MSDQELDNLLITYQVVCVRVCVCVCVAELGDIAECNEPMASEGY